MSLIFHIDVDAFFASVEQLLTPPLRGRAVIVGSGCIASCSYEARRFGLHAGMSLRRAIELCADAVVLPGSYQTYRCFAEHIWEICSNYACSLQTLLDEAYGDATGLADRYGGPVAMGRQLQERVDREVGLPVSIGLAGNAMLAKLASHAAKPHGVVWIPPGRESDFLDPLPVNRLPGVGPKTAARLADANIRTIADLRRLDRQVLRCMFARRGDLLYDRSRGLDRSEIRSQTFPKSISRETTFHQPQCDIRWIRGMLFYLAERAAVAARAAGLLAGCVEMSIRYVDFKGSAASRTLPAPTNCPWRIFDLAGELLASLHRRRTALRHIGVTLSKFSPSASEARLFDTPAGAKLRSLNATLDAIRNRYGHASIVAGESISLLGRLKQNDYGFVLRTPSLTK
ncbi:MAG: DNA polymerase IV [Phycisphaerae bacterium]|nr:DNA polymerase IV [Phycisphaerae bacterium]